MRGTLSSDSDDTYFQAIPSAITGDRALISDPAECRHLTRVLRKKPGDAITITDGEGRLFQGIIDRVDASGVHLMSLLERSDNGEPRVRITLAPALLKGSRLDGVVEKATEIGVNEFLPMTTERTVRSGDQSSSRHSRWERIALSAMKQSLRTRRPHLAPVADFESVMKQAGTFDLAMVAWEGEKRDTPASVIAACPPPGRMLITVGPEGGFTPEEIAVARCNKVYPVTLGPRRLRADTASIVVVTLALSALGELDACPSESGVGSARTRAGT